MCGINGIVSESDADIATTIALMNRELIHRGPEASEQYHCQTNGIALGMTRLAFLDIEANNLIEFKGAAGDCKIVFNGEIYNHEKVRRMLRHEGYSFSTNTDTEVVLNAYRHWGKRMFEHLYGMFAFGIWDPASRQLMLATDHFGTKPLYFYRGANFLIFSSELKSILRHPRVKRVPNRFAIVDYFTYKYIPPPRTVWENISKVPPATFLIFQNDTLQVQEQYWKVSSEDELKITVEDAGDALSKMLLISVEEQARCDVPVGAFLSAGYDSSSIVYYMKALGLTPDVFSVGFNGWAESEDEYAKRLADQWNCPFFSHKIVDQDISLVDYLAHFLDEPNGDVSTIPSYLACKLARLRRKAVLSGDGGDEALFGYPRLRDYTPYWRDHPLAVTDIVVDRSVDDSLAFYAYATGGGVFGRAELRSLFTKKWADYIPDNPGWYYSRMWRGCTSPERSMQICETEGGLPSQLLQKMDRTSMACSLEARYPFLKPEIIQFCISVPFNIHYHNLKPKALLRHVFKDVFPTYVLDRKKQGFIGPHAFYNNIAWYKGYLQESVLVNDAVISEAYLTSAIKRGDFWRLWKVAVLEAWWRRWV